MVGFENLAALSFQVFMCFSSRIAGRLASAKVDRSPPVGKLYQIVLTKNSRNTHVELAIRICGIGKWKNGPNSGRLLGSCSNGLATTVGTHDLLVKLPRFVAWLKSHFVTESVQTTLVCTERASPIS